MPNKKLFIIHNHKNFSGAARSLGELIINMKKKVDFYIICPEGSSSKFFKSLKVKVIETFIVPRFNHFNVGYYKGIRWFILIREILALIYFIFFLIKLKIKFKNISSFHLNELELFIVTPLLKLFFKPRITSHLRSIVEKRKGKFRLNFMKKICRKYIHLIVAIDYDCFNTSPNKKKTVVIYNGINKFNLGYRKFLNDKKKEGVTFGFIGNFIERKGIYQTLDVFKSLNPKCNAKLICVGKTNLKNKILNFFKFERSFDLYIKNNKIFEYKNIKILPMTFNLKDFYTNIDVILFPGFMDAVGRPVIEAALLKKPSIISLNKYNHDTAMKNNCLIFKPGDLNSFKQKILFFLKNKSKIKKMGFSAYKNAIKNFNINLNCKKFYKTVLDQI